MGRAGHEMGTENKMVQMLVQFLGTKSLASCTVLLCEAVRAKRFGAWRQSTSLAISPPGAPGDNQGQLLLSSPAWLQVLHSLPSIPLSQRAWTARWRAEEGQARNAVSTSVHLVGICRLDPRLLCREPGYSAAPVFFCSNLSPAL